jgi:hypothetical protein
MQPTIATSHFIQLPAVWLSIGFEWSELWLSIFILNLQNISPQVLPLQRCQWVAVKMLGNKT